MSLNIQCKCKSVVDLNLTAPKSAVRPESTLAAIASEFLKTQNAASDQSLHRLLTGISMQNIVKVKIFTRNP